jgi:hypothetical protein
MCYHAADLPDVYQPWLLRKSTWFIAAIVICLLILVLSNITYGRVSKFGDVGGSLTIKADPDAKIYVGDKQVGTGQVTYSWVQLFGDENNEPVAIEQHQLKADVTPEILSGPGAEALEVDSLNVANANYSFMRISDNQHLIRRADRSLDQIIVLVFDWKPVNQSLRRFILPVRIRKDSFFYSNGGGMSSYSGNSVLQRGVFGWPKVNVSVDCMLYSDSPPARFAEEIKTKGLWEPGHQK